jgi:hypothetical protein
MESTTTVGRGDDCERGQSMDKSRRWPASRRRRGQAARRWLLGPTVTSTCYEPRHWKDVRWNVEANVVLIFSFF